ncbi:MAG: diacylglycerol kinase family lipid kinase [Chloroflexi bacterium]|nr:diacylglycerol kinase family lipid kinase [Chloroflexota bacterium]
MPRIKVIVNPKAGRGHGARLSPRVAACLAERGADFDLVHTAGPGHAIELARQAVDEGFEIVVSVGGDGTSNEIVNGLMSRANGGPVGTLGWVPAGSGNDFAMMNGAPWDTEAACDLIMRGTTRLVDVGRVTFDGRLTRYFDNAVGIGFDGLVVRETQKLKHVRGLAMYLPAVLKTVFLSLRPIHAHAILDDKSFDAAHLMIVIANGPREGGSFLVAPNARCDDSYLDIITAAQMSKLRMLAMIPQFLKGTHLGDPRIGEARARRVTIRSEDPLYFHVDGEILCAEAHKVEAELLPLTLRVISPEGDGQR